MKDLISSIILLAMIGLWQIIQLVHKLLEAPDKKNSSKITTYPNHYTRDKHNEE